MKISVDFHTETGIIKPLHGVCNCPIRTGETKLPEYEEAGIPMVRTHDAGGYYGGYVFIDVPNIFRNFDADPEDPASYDFAFTDIYLRNLINSGCKVLYRLGITIENDFRIKAYRVHPPKDFSKWARICEHIIRHYNYGWADGFHYGIEYWEVWNEPENKSMWSGTREEFFQFFGVVVKHLKSVFPEIKTGGYASCGFYAVTRNNVSDFFRSFLSWFDDFIAVIKKENLPVDFFSWHLYTHDGEEIVKQSLYVQKKLEEAGLGHIEQMINEWNIFMNNPLGRWSFDAIKEFPAALEVARTFCLMQHSPLSKALYYDGEPTRTYCGLFYFPSQKVTPTYYSFKAFNELYKRRHEVKVKGSTKTVLALASADENSGAVLLLNNGQKEQVIELDLQGWKPEKVILHRKDHVYKSAKRLWKNGRLTIPGKSLIVLQVPFKDGIREEKEVYISQDKRNINGIAE